MPWSTAATFGAVAAILSASVSWPLTTYLSRHGCANGLAVAQFSRMLVKPMSLPADLEGHDLRVESSERRTAAGSRAPE